MSDEYLIRVQGHLDRSWSDWFGDLKISQDGRNTLLAGIICDQAALHGILAKVRDLGLFLISVQFVGPNSEHIFCEGTKE